MAYETKALVEKLKGHGLDLAEDAAMIMAECVLDWAAEEAVKSENKYDDLIVALVPVIKPVIMEYADKIDGKEG